jgi:hypothetical protein
MEDEIHFHGTRNGLTRSAFIILDLNISKESILSLYVILRRWNSCLETEIIQKGRKGKR